MKTFYHQATDTYVITGEPFWLSPTQGLKLAHLAPAPEDASQHPANWLSLASADDLADKGLTEVSTSGSAGDLAFFVTTETLVNGVRVITNTPKDTSETAALERAAVELLKTQVRAEREKVLTRLVGIGWDATCEGDKATETACRNARNALKDLTSDLPDNLNQAKLLIYTRYIAIRDALPEGVKNVFAGFDL